MGLKVSASCDVIPSNTPPTYSQYIGNYNYITAMFSKKENFLYNENIDDNEFPNAVVTFTNGNILHVYTRVYDEDIDTAGPQLRTGVFFKIYSQNGAVVKDETELYKLSQDYYTTNPVGSLEDAGLETMVDATLLSNGNAVIAWDFKGIDVGPRRRMQTNRDIEPLFDKNAPPYYGGIMEMIVSPTGNTVYNPRYGVTVPYILNSICMFHTNFRVAAIEGKWALVFSYTGGNVGTPPADIATNPFTNGAGTCTGTDYPMKCSLECYSDFVSFSNDRTSTNWNSYQLGVPEPEPFPFGEGTFMWIFDNDFNRNTAIGPKPIGPYNVTCNSAGSVIGMKKNPIFVTFRGSQYYQTGNDLCISAFNATGDRVMQELCLGDGGYPNLLTLRTGGTSVSPPLYFDAFLQQNDEKWLVGETMKAVPYNYVGTVGTKQEVLLVVASRGDSLSSSGSPLLLFVFSFDISDPTKIVLETQSYVDLIPTPTTTEYLATNTMYRQGYDIVTHENKVGIVHAFMNSATTPTQTTPVYADLWWFYDNTTATGVNDTTSTPSDLLWPNLCVSDRFVKYMVVNGDYKYVSLYNGRPMYQRQQDYLFESGDNAYLYFYNHSVSNNTIQYPNGWYMSDGPGIEHTIRGYMYCDTDTYDALITGCNGNWRGFLDKSDLTVPLNLETTYSSMQIQNETCVFDNNAIPRVICVKFTYLTKIPALNGLFDGTYERVFNWEQTHAYKTTVDLPNEIGESNIYIIFNAHSSGWYVMRFGLPTIAGSRIIGRCQGAPSYLLGECTNWQVAENMLVSNARVLGYAHCDNVPTPPPSLTPPPTTTTTVKTGCCEAKSVGLIECEDYLTYADCSPWADAGWCQWTCSITQGQI